MNRRKGPAKPPKKSKWQESATRWRSVGHEEAYQDIIITKVQRKPPRWFLETYDDNGAKITGVLHKRGKKDTNGFDLMLEGGGIHVFRTRRKALDFFGRLQRLETPDVVQDEEHNVQG